MKERLMKAYDQMTMPASCAGKIEKMLASGQKGIYFRRIPAGRRDWSARTVAAACLLLALLLGGGLLLRQERLRSEEPSMYATRAETTDTAAETETVPDTEVTTQPTTEPAETTEETIEQTTAPTTAYVPVPVVPPATTEPEGGNGILGNPEGHIHTFLDIKFEGAYTCEEGGSKIMTCQCGYVERYDIEPGSQHQYESVSLAYGSSPSCTMPGKAIMICLRCSHVTQAYDPVNYPALGHDYRITVVEPTETEQGYTEYYCNRCHTVTRDNYVDPIPQETQPATTQPEETKIPDTQVTENATEAENE